MRILIMLVTLLAAATITNAQSLLPLFGIDPGYRGLAPMAAINHNSIFKKKWSVTKYTGIATSFVFARGGSAAVVSVPVGLQLNRRLNNNLIAFAGASIAPSYVNFHQSFMSAEYNKTNLQNNYFKPGGLGMYSRAELGLQYVNDERTFSISGSIGIERSSYAMPFNGNTKNIQPISTNR